MSDFALGLGAMVVHKHLSSMVITGDFSERFVMAFGTFGRWAREEWKPDFHVTLNSAGESEVIRGIIDSLVSEHKAACRRTPCDGRLHFCMRMQDAQEILAEYPEDLYNALEYFLVDLHDADPDLLP